MRIRPRRVAEATSTGELRPQALRTLTEEILDAEAVTPYRVYSSHGSLLVTPGRYGSTIEVLD